MLKLNLTSLFILIIFVVSIFAVSVTAVDFSVGSETSAFELCSCGVVSDSFTVYNLGSEDASFMVYVEGSGASFVGFTENVFSLGIGEYKELNPFVGVPCGVIGNYDLNYIIESEGVRKELSKEVIVGECEILGMELVREGSICSGAEAIYEFELTNLNGYAENFSLENEEVLDYSENPVLLGPGESKRLFVTLKVPEESGEYNFIFNILGENSGGVFEKEFSLISEDCYSVSVSESEKGCVGGVYNIEVVNDGKAFEVVNISGDITNRLVSLAPGQTEVLVFNANTAGVFETNVNLIDTKIEVEHVLEVISQQECYLLDFSFEDIQMGLEEMAVSIDFRNDGLKRGIYSLSTNLEWVTIVPNVLELEVGEEEKVHLVISPKEEGIFELNVGAQGDNGSLNYVESVELKVRESKMGNFLGRYGLVIVLFLILLIVFGSIINSFAKMVASVGTKKKTRKRIKLWVGLLVFLVVVFALVFYFYWSFLFNSCKWLLGLVLSKWQYTVSAVAIVFAILIVVVLLIVLIGKKKGKKKSSKLSK